MTILFEATDPRGWRVICTEKQWTEHVLAFHEEQMEGCEAEVKKTIESPMYGIIYSDKEDLSRCIYYSRRSTTTYLKVVVAYDQQAGFLITAFPIHEMKSGEFPIWRSLNR